MAEYNLDMPNREFEQLPRVHVATAVLSGKALDWAVALAQGWTPYFHRGTLYRGYVDDRDACQSWCPHLNGDQSYPLLEAQRVALVPTEIGWKADGYATLFGPTMIVAGLRYYVYSKLGWEVKIPQPFAPDVNS